MNFSRTLGIVAPEGFRIGPYRTPIDIYVTIDRRGDVNNRVGIEDYHFITFCEVFAGTDLVLSIDRRETHTEYIRDRNRCWGTIYLEEFRLHYDLERSLSITRYRFSFGGELRQKKVSVESLDIGFFAHRANRFPDWIRRKLCRREAKARLVSDRALSLSRHKFMPDPGGISKN